MECKQDKFIALAREIYKKGKAKGMTWNDAQKKASEQIKDSDKSRYEKYRKYWMKKTNVYLDSKLSKERKAFLKANADLKPRLKSELGSHYKDFKMFKKQKKSS